eukprot:6059955-Pleurochrysis_carterae.AAC.2
MKLCGQAVNAGVQDNVAKGEFEPTPCRHNGLGHAIRFIWHLAPALVDWCTHLLRNMKLSAGIVACRKHFFPLPRAVSVPDF